MSPVSFIPNTKNREFLAKMTEGRKLPKTQVINHALDLMRRYTLKKELMEGFSLQREEDVLESMSDFNDYLAIVDSE